MIRRRLSVWGKLEITFSPTPLSRMCMQFFVLFCLGLDQVFFCYFLKFDLILNNLELRVFSNLFSESNFDRIYKAG